MDEIRVVIVDDHPFFREGLRNVLSAEPGLVVVGEAADGEEAVQQAAALLPDVMLMDVNLPRMNGLQATRRVKDTCPQVNVVVLTAYDDEEQIFHAVRAGASAYHPKDVDPARLVATIREVAAGRYVIGGAVLTEEALGRWLLERYRQFGGELSVEDRRLSPLSEREMEILRLVVAGKSNKEIAYHLGISHQTVKNHITAVLSKLGLEDRTQAAVYALRRGWVPLRSGSDDGSA